MGAGLHYQITRFESDFATDLNNDTHTVFTRGRFRFLPRTSLVYNGAVSFMHYVNADERGLKGLASANTVRSTVGLDGLLTDRLNLLAAVGWGASFYDERRQRYARLRLGDRSGRGEVHPHERRAGGAAARRFRRSRWARRATSRTRTSATSTRRIAHTRTSCAHRRALLHGGTAGIASIRYGDVLGRTSGTPIAPAFRNSRIDASLFGEYRVTNWFGVNGSCPYINEISDTNIPFGGRRSGGRILQHRVPALSSDDRRARVLLSALRSGSSREHGVFSFFAVLAALVTVSVLASCSAPTARSAKLPPPNEVFTVGPGDVFEVYVYEEPSLSRSYKVAPNGTIDFPLVGTLEVDGKEPSRSPSCSSSGSATARSSRTPSSRSSSKRSTRRRSRSSARCRSRGSSP